MHGVLELVSIPYGAEIVQYIGMDIVAPTSLSAPRRSSSSRPRTAQTVKRTLEIMTVAVLLD